MHEIYRKIRSAGTFAALPKIMSDRIRGPNEIVNDLLRNVPGPGDADPLRVGYLSGIITPDDYRYIIQRIDGKVFAEYIGGGNPDFGRHVQSQWVPNMTPKEIRNMVEDYGREKISNSSD